MTAQILRGCCPSCLATFRGAFHVCPHDATPLVASNRDPMLSSVLAGKYRIEKHIAEGNFGLVYRACHVSMPRNYAIKVLFGDVSRDQQTRARFTNEARASAQLQHPNLVGACDVGETPEGLPYLVMDLAEGTSLADILVTERQLPVPRALAYLAQIADGLHHLHATGHIHRDVKPGNVVIHDDRARLIDFGLALAAGEPNRLTTEDGVVGTPAYMSPEQATKQALDARSDVFSLGLVLYEMIAGRLPFDGSPSGIARQNVACDLPSIASLVSGVNIDPLVEGFIGWLTQKEPADRPTSAQVVAEVARLLMSDRAAAVARIPGCQPVVIQEAPAPPSPARTTPRRRMWLAVDGLMLAILLVWLACLDAPKDTMSPRVPPRTYPEFQVIESPGVRSVPRVPPRTYPEFQVIESPGVRSVHIVCADAEPVKCQDLLETAFPEEHLFKCEKHSGSACCLKRDEDKRCLVQMEEDQCVLKWSCDLRSK